MSAPKRKLTDEEIRSTALFAARLGGCTCNPDIRIRGDGMVRQTEIAHDPSCDHPSQRKGRDA